MNFLRPEELLQSGYKDCLLCEVERKGEEKRCLRCSGKAEQRDRLLWEINRERIHRNAARLSLAYPGAGHFYSGRDLAGPGAGEPAAPCQKACPADINVPDYIALVREGRPLEALALVHDKLPFAAFCGRACPHPCEQECVRTEYGAPLAIMAIKRYAAALGYAAAFPPSPPVAEGMRRPKVAVVGAGPAGLCAADTLARLGCKGTVFDEEAEPGGRMRDAVPEFRFPKEALWSDVRTILARGVDFRGEKKFGRGLSFESLAGEGFG